jgi:tetratricopeptide (TPR) repeat protein
MTNDDERIRLAKSEFESAKEREGAEHPSTLDAMTRLAAAYQGAADFGRAEKVLNVEFSIRSRLFGDSDYATVRSAHRLGYSLFKQGQLRRAEELQQYVLTSFSEKYGPNSELTVSAMNNLALTLGKRRRYDAQVNILHAMVDACVAIWGPSSYQARDALVLLGEGYRSLRDFERALQADRRAADCRDNLDVRQVDQNTLHLNIAKDLMGLGRREEAAKVLVEMWDSIQNLGPDDPIRLQFSSALSQGAFKMLKRQFPNSP